MIENNFDTPIKTSRYDKPCTNVGVNIRRLEENDSELMAYLELL